MRIVETKEKEFYTSLIETYKLKKILPSCHLNFLLGAGFNGSLFPQLKGFRSTIKKMKEYNEKLPKNFNFEEEIASLNAFESDSVLSEFVKEFGLYNSKVDYTDNSYESILSMIENVYNIVERTENTIPSMSKVNIFTFNYDCIVEKAIQELGFFVNVIKPSNLKTIRYHNVLIRGIDNNRYLPSFVVSKLHGSYENGDLLKDNIILPGLEKYNNVLNKDSFELLFKMKTELLKENSIIIIIGYSWNDEHVNQVLMDCYKNGLTIIRFKYNKKDTLHKDFKGKVIEIGPYDKPIDTTKTFSNLIDAVLEK